MINAMLVMLGIGGVLGLILSIASIIFHVEVDEREEKVNELLPGYNCGACGFPGCSGFAHALVSGETKGFACKVTKADQKEKIVTYLANTPDKDGNVVTIK